VAAGCVCAVFVGSDEIEVEVKIGLELELELPLELELEPEPEPELALGLELELGIELVLVKGIILDEVVTIAAVVDAGTSYVDVIAETLELRIDVSAV